MLPETKHKKCIFENPNSKIQCKSYAIKDSDYCYSHHLMKINQKNVEKHTIKAKKLQENINVIAESSKKTILRSEKDKETSESKKTILKAKQDKETIAKFIKNTNIIAESSKQTLLKEEKDKETIAKFLKDRSASKGKLSKSNKTTKKPLMSQEIQNEELKSEIAKSIKNYPEAVSKEIVNMCIKNIQKTLLLENFVKSICGTCGQMKYAKNMINYSINLLLKQRNFFKPCSLLKNALDANEFIYAKNPNLNGLVFCRNSINYDSNTIKICDYCKRYLNGIEKRNRFLANGFYREVNCMNLPELSIAELHLISINRPHLKIISLRQIGTNLHASSFKGNAICYKQNVKEICKVLPRTINDLTSTIQILYTGTGHIPLAYIKKLVEVRLPVIYQWLRFLKDVSKIQGYVNMEIDKTRIEISELNVDGIPLCLLKNVQQFSSMNVSLTNLQMPVTGSTDEDFSEIDQTGNPYPLFHQLSTIDIDSNQSNKDDLIRLLSQPNRFYIVKGNEPVSKYEDDRYYENSFPNSFPWGCGGPNSLNVSLEKYIENYVLDDGSRTLQRNQDFLSLIYSDTMSRKVEASFSIVKKTQKYNHYLKTIQNEVSADSIQNLIEALHKKDNSYLKDTTFVTISPMLNIVGKNIPGTPSERNHQRLLAQGTLMSLGMYHFFFTSNFDDIHHPLVATLCGKIVKFTEEGFISEPDLNERRRISCYDAVAVADFAYLMMKIMMLDLFGFDVEQRKTTKRGIFNYIENFIGNFHDQNRGGLHIHFGGYIYGNPNPLELHEKLNNLDFKSKYICYSDTLFQTSSPNIIDNQPISSVNDFQLPPKFNDTPQYTLQLSNYAKRVSQRSMIHSHKPTCIKKLDPEELKLVTDLHNLPDHLCREGYGRDLVQQTIIEMKDHESFLKLKRFSRMSVESNYTVTEQLNNNSAGHLIDSGLAGLTSCLYSLNYMSGHQSNDPILWESILHRYNKIEAELKLKYQMNPIDNEYTAELKFMKTAFYGMLAQSQKSLCFIAMYLRKYSIHYNTANIIPIYYKYFIDFVSNIKQKKDLDIWVTLHDEKNICVDYAYRGNESSISHLSPISYIRHVIRTNSKYDEHTYNFDPKHASFMKLFQKFNESSDLKIPIFYPPSQVPNTDIDTMNEDGALFIIVFFSNWTIESFQRIWTENSLIDYAKQIVHDLKSRYSPIAISMQEETNNYNYLYQMYLNMQVYYKASNQIKLYVKNKYTLPSHRHYVGSEELLNLDDEEVEEEEDINENIETNLPMDIDYDDITDTIMKNYLPRFNEQDEHKLALYLNVMNQSYNSNSDVIMKENDSNISNIIPNDNLIEIVKSYINDKQNNLLYERSLEIQSLLYPKIEHSIMLIERDLNSLFTDKDFVTMKSIIEELNLTKSQIFPFIIFGGQLNRQLQSFNDQFHVHMIIFGCAGSGKSFVEKAIRKYFHYKKSQALLLKSALYGAQAANFEGNTLHHNMNWIGITTRQKKLKSVFQATNHSVYWENLNLHLIDEVYLLDGKLFNACYKSTLDYRKSIDVNIGYIGDPYQLYPVKRTPIFFDIKNVSIKYQEEKLGQCLYKDIPFACEILGNHRSSTDFANFLENYRNGIVTPEHLIKLEKRRRNISNVPEDTAYLVSVNTLKVHINFQKCISYAKKRNLKVHWCFSYDAVHPNTHEIRDRILLCNRDLSDMKTKNLANIIPLVLQHEYIITMNLCPEIGLAKGRKCKLISIKWENPQDEFTKYKLPKYLEMQFERVYPKLDFPLLKNQDHQTFILYPMNQSLQLPYIDNDNNQIHQSFVRYQFPIIPANAFTLYRALGQTLSSIAILLSSCHTNIERYTALSRVHDWDNLYLLDEDVLNINMIISEWSPHQIQEMNRLRSLDEKTKRNIWKYFPSRLKSFYDSFEN